jgi:hypothetical protein
MKRQRKRAKSQTIVDNFGLMWARNPKNLAKLPERTAGGEGVYILYDGSMPVYAGRGGFKRRIAFAGTTHKRAQAWTHFSWFAVKDRSKHHDLEMLMIKSLPRMLRLMNRCEGKFVGPKKAWTEDDPVALPITRKLSFTRGKRSSEKVS